MLILPVLDLLDGVVVRGVAGRRAEYRPVESVLCRTAAAPDVARAFRERLGLTTLYVADLDAILHDRPNVELYRQLAGDSCELVIDAGARDIEHIQAVLDSGAAAAVIGLETLPDPILLDQAVERFGSERILFSLDLMDGRPLARDGMWASADPVEIAARAAASGVRRVIVLDLAAVGVNGGVSTRGLCRELRDRCPELRLITGGGIRGPDDLRDLAPLGLEGVLVASAFHDGRWNPAGNAGIVSAPAPNTAARRRATPQELAMNNGEYDGTAPGPTATAPGVLQVYEVGELTVVGFGGKDVPDDTCLTAYRSQLQELIKTHGTRILAFDLQGVKLIPSGLLGLIASCRNLGVEIELFNPSGDIREVLRITGLDAMLTVRDVDSEDVDSD